MFLLCKSIILFILFAVPTVSLTSFRKILVDIIPNIPICQRFTVLFLICSQFEADYNTQVKLKEVFIPSYPTNQINGFFYFALLLRGMNLRLLKLRRFHQKPCYLLKQIANVISMSRRKIKTARKIKGKALLKRKKKDLERENIVHSWVNQIVIVRKTQHQRTQIWTMVHHQNLQRTKCPRMSIPRQGSLSCLQRKRINGNLASN